MMTSRTQKCQMQNQCTDLDEPAADGMKRKVAPVNVAPQVLLHTQHNASHARASPRVVHGGARACRALHLLVTECLGFAQHNEHAVLRGAGRRIACCSPRRGESRGDPEDACMHERACKPLDPRVDEGLRLRARCAVTMTRQACDKVLCEFN